MESNQTLESILAKKTHLIAKEPPHVFFKRCLVQFVVKDLLACVEKVQVCHIRTFRRLPITDGIYFLSENRGGPIWVIESELNSDGVFVERGMLLSCKFCSNLIAHQETRIKQLQ
jgi:hypothetical protein